MNKTNYIILIIALCFSLAFVVYPLKTFSIDCDFAGCNPYDPPEPSPTPSDNGGGDNGGEGSLSPSEDYGYYFAIVSDANGTTSFLNPVPKEDAMAEVPTDLKIGEKWTGPSGQTYIATAPASTEPGAEQINSILNSTLVPVDSSPDGGDGEDKEWNCKVCNASNKCVYQTFSQKCDNACGIDKDCENPSIVTDTPTDGGALTCECGSHTEQVKHCFLFICWYTSTGVCNTCSSPLLPLQYRCMQCRCD